jgi:hypothetical protein
MASYIGNPEVGMREDDVTSPDRNEIYHLQVRFKYLGMSTNNKPMFISVAVDNTARKKIELQLQKKQEDLEMLSIFCNSSPVMMVL